jgi:hypothetical protein
MYASAASASYSCSLTRAAHASPGYRETPGVVSHRVHVRTINQLRDISPEAKMDIEVGIVEPQGSGSSVARAECHQRLDPAVGRLQIVAISRKSLATARDMIVVVVAVGLTRGTNTPVGLERGLNLQVATG